MRAASVPEIVGTVMSNVGEYLLHSSAAVMGRVTTNTGKGLTMKVKLHCSKCGEQDMTFHSLRKQDGDYRLTAKCPCGLGHNVGVSNRYANEIKEQIAIEQAQLRG